MTTETLCTLVEHVRETGVRGLRTEAVMLETLREEGPAGAQGLRAVGSKRPRAVVSPGDSVPRWLRIPGTYSSISRGAT